ncbi:MAG: phosphoenolpyruvate carboxykinase (GTP), partial [Phycisphaerae bacterium]
EEPPRLLSWLGESWTPGSGKKAAHPNARFTAPAAQCPVIDPKWEDPQGVPISAILFGGRRASVVPLAYEAFSWRHGTFLGSVMSSEMTAAAAGKIGVLRRDPMAMLPFCGYNMGDYFAHWLSMPSRTDESKLPRIFYVNWFRKSADGKWLWPGYGENVRVLKWIFERLDAPADGQANAVKTPIGYVPSPGAIDTTGLNLPPGNMDELLKVDPADWRPEIDLIREHYAQFGDRLPSGLVEELEALRGRLG